MIYSLALNACRRFEEVRYASHRHVFRSERVRVAAGLLQTETDQPLLPREDVDPGVRSAPRVTRQPPRAVNRMSSAACHEPGFTHSGTMRHLCAGLALIPHSERGGALIAKRHDLRGL